ncbi:hypothetical protein EJB05_12264, partial [Eragrostis curvula]
MKPRSREPHPPAAAAAMATSAAAEGRRALDAYRKALATAASAAAYAVMARSMARDLLPKELQAAARWAASAALARLGRRERERRTLVVRSLGGDAGGLEENLFFDAARAYLGSRLDPRAMRRLGLTLARTRDDGGGASWRRRLFIEPGDSTVDVFDGVEFTWTCVGTPRGGGGKTKAAKSGGGEAGTGGDLDFLLELSFDAEHADAALERYVPFIMDAAEDARQRERRLKICMNEGRSWYGFSHHHPATFDTLAMDPAQKQAIVDDLDLFAQRRDHYRRIGKAWKRGYLLHGPPGTGKSSLVAAMANHLRYHLYDLDLSRVRSNTDLQWLLLTMSNKCILVIEDIDCCCNAISREAKTKKSKSKLVKAQTEQGSSSPFTTPAKPKSTDQKELQVPGFQVTLSGLLNLIDGLWSTSGEERIIVFTTNYKDRLDPALLRPGRMDMHIHMGYCSWEAFKTLAKNYFLVSDHAMFPEIQELLAEVEMTTAEVSEMLLRSNNADIALQGLKDLLKEKKQGNEAGRKA